MKKFLYGAAIVAMIFGCIYGNLYVFAPTVLYGKVTTREFYSYALYSLKDGKEINGKMSGGIFCTSGYINEVLYYDVLVSENGTLNYKKIPAEKAKIKIDNNELPSVTYYGEVFENGKALDDWTWHKDYYLLVLPENSVYSDMNIDLT